MRKHLSKHEIKELEPKLAEYSIPYSKKDEIVIEDRIIFINKKPTLFYHEKTLVPTLKSIFSGAKLKTITVDMGAIRFVVSGADIMRPGIMAFDEGIKEKELVVVVDVNNKKPLAIGVALMDSEMLQNTKIGKSVKNIHYIGDEIWKTE